MLHGSCLQAELLCIDLGFRAFLLLQAHDLEAYKIVGVGQCDVAVDRHMQEQAVLSVLGQHADAAAQGFVRCRRLIRLAEEGHAAFIDALEAEDRFDDLRRAAADQTGQTQHLALFDLEADIMEVLVICEAVHFHQRFAVVFGVVFLRIELGDLTADHAGDHVVLFHLVDRLRFADDLAVTQDRDAGADAEDFFELVRDKDEGNALLLEAFNNSKQVINFRLSQRGSWFIQNQELHVAGQTLCDLDQLPDAEAECLHDRVDAQIAEADTLEDVLCALSARALVQDVRLAKAVHIAHQDIFHDGHGTDQRQLLIDHADAEVPRDRRACNFDLFPFPIDAACIRCQRAGENLHERRLTGAVFAEQHMDFAFFNSEADILQGMRRTERLSDAFHLQYSITHILIS